MQIQRSKITILIIILKLIEKHRRSYCWPTRKTIQSLLLKYHSIDISIFCIDKHLRDLTDLKYIKSFRRYGRREDGTCFNKPSNRQLTKTGLAFLFKLGIRVSLWLKNHIFPSMGNQKRFSHKKIFQSSKDEDIERRYRNTEFSTIGKILNSAI